MTEHVSATAIMDEKPLSPAARAGLVVNAAVTILLFYLTAILFMAGFTALALLLLLVTMAAARFGMASFVGRLLQVPVRLIGILGRKLWLPSETTYRIALTREDAPDLFAIARELSRRSAVAPAESIFIEMHSNAWVMMRGYRRGTGRTTLGIGFDLLAGLTVTEVEAVLAHELAHARLVQRGFSRWLKKGLARLTLVTTELSDCAAAYRQANARSDLTETTVRVFDALTRRAARHVATYSRQDEFAADRGAVELCGAAIRSALARLEVLDEVVTRLPWSERLARLQPGEAFTAWLVNELTGPGRGDGGESLAHAVDPYSTHPALRDRLAALPADDTPLRDSRPGTALLADPDSLAGRLAAEIQRVIAVQERKDTRQRARETRKLCRAEGIGGPVALLGVGALIVGLVLGLIGATSGFPLDMMGTAVGALIAGVLLVRYPRYRDRRPLPVPAYGTLSNPRPPETQEQLAAAEEAIVAELRASAARERTRRARCALLVSTSYAALQEHGRLGVIRRKAGFQTLVTKWGAAWALSLLDDWSCEGLLQQLHDRRPDTATFASLLALAQLHRHKLQSAIENAARGVALEPANRGAVLLLAHVLLLAGRTADAAARLDPLQDHARTDVGAAFLMVRLRVMQRDTAGALEWAGVVRGLDPDGAALIGLGQAFGAARLAEPAATFLTAAADAGFAPEANIGFAVLASSRGDRAGAKRHLLAALKFDGARFTKGQTVGSLFHEILGRLNA